MPEMQQAQTSQSSTSTPMVKPMDTTVTSTTKKSERNLYIIVGVVAVVLGVATGYLLNSHSKSSNGTAVTISSQNSGVAKGKIYGTNDESLFKDQAEGTLQKGGINGEGTHKLIRPGGDSQTVYLTSSTIDLDQFIDKKVKVWGQTNKAQSSGWFMDVGRLEVE